MKSYNKLVALNEKLHNLAHLGSIVSWDQQTMMPAGSNDARSKAMAEFGVLMHQLSTDPKIGDNLELAANEDLDSNQRATLREMRRSYEMATILPEKLVKAKSLAGSKCEHAWRDQRGKNDWSGFLDNFKEVVSLSREEANLRADKSGLTPYDALVDLYEPGMTSKTLDSIFNDVKSWLPKLIEDVVEKQKSINIIEPVGPFSVESQKELGLKVMAKLGFDFNKGRVDISSHPFCGGVSEDIRMTTRYDESDFVQSLMGIVHETGHARYEQNLPKDFLALPSGSARSMGIHESQSLFFEMQIGRGRPFLESIHKDLIDCFGDKDFFSLDNLVKIYGRVQPGFIRVDADEVTYPAHVILRYEIERDLINGKIEASDIPDIWNDLMMKYLGIDTKGNFSQGPMQDIHWTDGAFGYFPSYTLGAMYAAQQFNTVEKLNPSIHDSIARGDYSAAFDWLKKNIWEKGSLLTTNELIVQATGEELNPKFLKDHLVSRYL
ncbi:carboxypeptidase M32 [Halobacteriovorax sp. HLS]|uniref:carboxypeptidase M32 n=1 Tax=Halobacteriovorax sp. HLS TaxID=2234000 RepID=UPI000FDB4723|nr:carboxypeptidase M32 [Halobacteriovorax sp. HLS]